MRIDMSSLWLRYVSILSFIGIITGLYFFYQLPLEVIISIVTLFLIIFVTMALAANISPTLTSMEKALKSIERTLEKANPKQNPSNPHGNPSEDKKEEEIRTTGSGALAGMVVGGLLGLVAGPVGVVVAGLIGAIAGDQLEHEGIRAEKEEQRNKRKKRE